MPTCCPYCHSTQVHRVFISHPQQDMHLFSLASKIGFGAMIFKRLSTGLPLSPWMLKLAEVLLSGLMNYLIELQKNSNSESGIVLKFYCEDCQRSFKT